MNKHMDKHMDKHMNKQLPDSRPETDRLAIAIIGISVLLMLAYEIFGVEKFILKVDPYEYYTYLPKWFIDHEFSYGSKYPIGVALLEMPSSCWPTDWLRINPDTAFCINTA